MKMKAGTRRIVLGLAALATAIACPALAAETVLIPGRIIYPGEPIDASALKAVTLIEGKAPPAEMAVSLADLEGRIARRTLLPGRYVPVSALRDAYLVEKGAAVEMIFAAGALTISVNAVTLQPGSAGDEVKVRNIDSGKVLSGTLMADGTVRVGGI